MIVGLGSGICVFNTAFNNISVRKEHICVTTDHEHCLICRSYDPVLLSNFMIYYRIHVWRIDQQLFDMFNTTGVTSGKQESLILLERMSQAPLYNSVCVDNSSVFMRKCFVAHFLSVYSFCGVHWIYVLWLPRWLLQSFSQL